MRSPNPHVTRKRRRKRGEELSVDSAIEASNVEGPAGESISHGTVGTSVVGTEGTAPGASTVEMEDSFGPGAIDTQSFYRPTEISRTYGDKKPRTSVPANLEGDSRRGVSLET